MSKLIETRNLAIGYGTDLLSNINFEVSAGDFICLMGENGCGKSTLLRTLSKLHSKRSGEVRLQNKNIEEFSSHDLSKLISVVLTQKISLENRTVREVILLGRIPFSNIWGNYREIDYKFVQKLMERFELAKLSENLFDELSDGQKQRVMICRAFAQDTPIIILDEPTTFLDVSQRFEVMLLIKEIAIERNAAVIFSSHDWELALAICNTVWLVNRDLSLTEGMPEELILEGKIAAVFKANRSILNMQSGSFVPKRENRRAISLTGDDCNIIRWTQHALEKIGLRVDRVASSKISVAEKSWRLELDGSNRMFSSLRDLTDHLSNTYQE